MVGPRYNKTTIASGAQTSRPGDAGPVSSMLGGSPSPAIQPKPSLRYLLSPAYRLQPPARLLRRAQGQVVQQEIDFQVTQG